MRFGSFSREGNPVDACTELGEGTNTVLWAYPRGSCGRLIKREDVDLTAFRRLSQEIVVALQWSTLRWICQVMTDPEKSHNIAPSSCYCSSTFTAKSTS